MVNALCFSAATMPCSKLRRSTGGKSNINSGCVLQHTDEHGDNTLHLMAIDPIGLPDNSEGSLDTGMFHTTATTQTHINVDSKGLYSGS